MTSQHDKQPNPTTFSSKDESLAPRKVQRSERRRIFGYKNRFQKVEMDKSNTGSENFERSETETLTLSHLHSLETPP